MSSIKIIHSKLFHDNGFVAETQKETKNIQHIQHTLRFDFSHSPFTQSPSKSARCRYTKPNIDYIYSCVSWTTHTVLPHAENK